MFMIILYIICLILYMHNKNVFLLMFNFILKNGALDFSNNCQFMVKCFENSQ